MAIKKKKEQFPYVDYYLSLPEEDRKKEDIRMVTEITNTRSKLNQRKRVISENLEKRKEANFFNVAIPMALCGFMCAIVASLPLVFGLFLTATALFFESRLKFVSNFFQKIIAKRHQKKLDMLEARQNMCKEALKVKEADKEEEAVLEDKQEEKEEDKVVSTVLEDEQLNGEEKVENLENKNETVLEEKVEEKSEEKVEKVTTLSEDEKAADILAGVYKKSQEKKATSKQDTGRDGM